MKRLFFIIAGIIVVIGLLVGGYFLFFANKQPTLTTVTGTNSFGDTAASDATGNTSLVTGSLSNAGTEVGPRLIKITDGPVSEGSVAIDRSPIYAAATSTTSTSSAFASTTVVSVASTTVASATSTKTVTTKKVITTTTPAPVPQVLVQPADTEVRYIDRASGNVYSFMTHARTLTRISNKTLPGIQYASWLPDGSRAYVQYLSKDSVTGGEDVSTYALQPDGSAGSVLEQDLAEAEAVGSSTLFTLLSGTTGSVGSLARTDGSNERVVFTLPLGSLVVHPTTGTLFASTKASSALLGYGFSINSNTGSFTRILGGLRGLTILPNPQGTAVLYSYNDSGTYRMAVYDTTTRVATALPVATLTEKCTWAASGLSVYCAIPTSITGDMPDLWYQGVTAFTDRIWKIDLLSRTANVVLDPSQIGKVSIDATALSVDPNEDVLVFSDRVTGSLWLYDL